MATHPPGISDAAVKAKTGRSWAAWRKTLDAAGATTMDHAAIVRLLTARFKLNGWWAQSVTVGYERLTGKRAVHQKKDGFAASIGRTFTAPARALFAPFDEAAARRRLLGKPVTFSTRTRNKTLRFAWPDGGRVAIAFYPKPGGKTQVSVQHEKLPSAAAVTRAKTFWRGVLTKLARAVQY
jgi:hypothetical protein